MLDEVWMQRAKLDGLDTSCSMEGTLGKRDLHSKMHHKNVRMVVAEDWQPYSIMTWTGLVSH